MPFVRSPSVLSYQNDIEFMETTGRRLCWFINETSSSMDDKRKTKHEFIRQAIKEAVARMKPELHAASDAAHQLFEEAEAEDQADFERTVELGYVVDRLANFCGPNLAVLYELACALDEFHGSDEQEPERAQRDQPHKH
jgi:hypothetical protein